MNVRKHLQKLTPRYWIPEVRRAIKSARQSAKTGWRVVRLTASFGPLDMYKCTKHFGGMRALAKSTKGLKPKSTGFLILNARGPENAKRLIEETGSAWKASEYAGAFGKNALAALEKHKTINKIVNIDFDLFRRICVSVCDYKITDNSIRFAELVGNYDNIKKFLELYENDKPLLNRILNTISFDKIDTSNNSLQVRFKKAIEEAKLYLEPEQTVALFAKHMKV